MPWNPWPFPMGLIRELFLDKGDITLPEPFLYDTDMFYITLHDSLFITIIVEENVYHNIIYICLQTQRNKRILRVCHHLINRYTFDKCAHDYIGVYAYVYKYVLSRSSVYTVA